MAKVKPFRAVRPSKGKEEQIAALPYDVYNRSEAYDEVKKNPGSFLAIDRPETQFAPDADMYSDPVYEKASQMLNTWIDEGRFVCEEKPCYYIYELVMDGRVQTGLAACASIDDYDNNVIKKHENTRADKEQDRIRHVDACSAQTGPIFLAYRANTVISSIVDRVRNNEPLYDFTCEDRVTHRVWIIDDDRDTAEIEAAFESVDSIYIADGHHRCASAVKVGHMRRQQHPDYDGTEEFNFFLSVLFCDEQLMIMDYNRVVKDLYGHSPEKFVELLEDAYEVSELEGAQKPEAKGCVSMFLDGSWYSLKYKGSLPEDPVEQLDVSILQKEVLTPLLGIEDPRTDSRIDFVGGIRGLKELEKRVNSDCRVAFAMYPTQISELFDVSDAGLLMPPKSTWFEPKLRSGLFIHRIER